MLNTVKHDPFPQYRPLTLIEQYRRFLMLLEEFVAPAANVLEHFAPSQGVRFRYADGLAHLPGLALIQTLHDFGFGSA